MKAISTALVLLLLGVAVGIVPPSAASAAESKPGTVFRWEYRVLTEEQVAALGKKDLAAGLNELGGEGWELVTAGAHYIFKRPKDVAQKQAAAIKREIAAAEADIEVWTERVAWSERMLRKGYVTEKHVQSERAQLKKAEAVLDEARRALKSLPTDPKQPEQKEPRPEK
jgi:hypothetical protein